MTTRTTTGLCDVQARFAYFTSRSPTATPNTTWAGPEDPHTRLKDHRRGRGARLMELISAAGIRFTLARTRPGTRNLERGLKDRGHARLCRICQATECGLASKHGKRQNRVAGDRQPARRTPG